MRVVLGGLLAVGAGVAGDDLGHRVVGGDLTGASGSRTNCGTS
jgi:hypothetical protein